MASIATPTEPRASAVRGPDPSLIAKYSTQGPRYTSYPTALEFSEQFTVADYEQHLDTARNDAAPLSLYVHVPFCRWLCYYCGCNKVVTKKSGAGRDYI